MKLAIAHGSTFRSGEFYPESLPEKLRTEEVLEELVQGGSALYRFVTDLSSGRIWLEEWEYEGEEGNWFTVCNVN